MNAQLVMRLGALLVITAHASIHAIVRILSISKHYSLPPVVTISLHATRTFLMPGTFTRIKHISAR